jgi:outer membrane protein assembly factor BamA
VGRRIVVQVALVLAVLVARPARGMEEIDAEEQIAELLATPPSDAAESDAAARRWAVLPQIGYGPETGPEAGLKYEHRNLGDTAVTLDVNGVFALNKQQAFELSVGTPHLLDDRFLVLFSARYDVDPTYDFFGLGNNDVGPDPVSTHAIERAQGALTVGWRPWPHVAIDFGVGLRHVRIGHGDHDDDGTPFTLDVFPNLPGVDGGLVNPLELSLVWSTRDAVVRPTRGWRGILKVSHTDRSLLSDFEFTRWVADLSYLYSLRNGAHVLGARLNGGFIAGPRRDIPFWELEELGGSDSLRGFFPNRFRGTSRVLLNVEYRARLTTFDFLDWWQVQIDGVLFGEAGRVFIDNGELSNEFKLNRSIIDRVVGDLQYSYGPGLRVALSRALVARIDVGFSEEETALVYLAFGQTF